MHPHTPTLWHTAVLEPSHPRYEQWLEDLICEVARQRPSTRGLTRQLIDAEKRAASWLLEGLYQAYFSLPRAALSIPQSKRFYVASRQSPFPFPFGVIRRLVCAAESLGWISVHTGVRCPSVSRVTTIQASGKLERLFDQHNYGWNRLIGLTEDRLIVVADASPQKIRRIVSVDEAPQVGPWQKNLHEINSFLLSHSIYLDAPDELILDLALRQGAVIQNGSSNDVRVVNFSQVTMRRIFARDRLDRGGRFYGGWWQSIPSKYRKYIGIDGDLCVEADFSGMALNCLYALEGAQLGHEDPYDVGLAYTSSHDPRRKIVKKCLNAILNDEFGRFRPSNAELQTVGLKWRELRDRLAVRHAAVSRHFHTGVGLHLQFLESEIAEKVMLRFVRDGHVCLPIHDSFVVPVWLLDHLVAVMNEEFVRRFGREISIKPEERPAGESLAVIGHHPVPPGLSEKKQNGVVIEIHLARFSIALGYFMSWIIQNKSPEEVDAEYRQPVEAGERVRIALELMPPSSSPPWPD